MREDYERTYRLALRYANKAQRRHIEQTRYDWNVSHPHQPKLTLCLPDTHPAYITIAQMARERGCSVRLLQYMFKDAIEDRRLLRSTWDTINTKWEADECLRESRLTMSRLSKTA